MTQIWAPTSTSPASIVVDGDRVRPAPRLQSPGSPATTGPGRFKRKYVDARIVRRVVQQPSDLHTLADLGRRIQVAHVNETERLIAEWERRRLGDTGRRG